MEVGISIPDLDLLTIGLVLDIWTEKGNDSVEYATLATQEDFDDPLLKSLYIDLTAGRSPASLVEEQPDEPSRARVSRLLLTPPSENTDQLIRMADISGDSLWLTLMQPKTFAPVVAFIGCIFYVFLRNAKKKNIGQIMLGFGISFCVIANAVMNSGEAFVKAVSDTTRKDFGTLKIWSEYQKNCILHGRNTSFIQFLTGTIFK